MPDSDCRGALIVVSENGIFASGFGKSSRAAVCFLMLREVEIVNKLGLHARPAALFVRWVGGFKSTITIWKGEEKFSAASLLDVLTANLNCGARVVLEAIGPDEHEALNKLELLLLSFRDEERALN
jgi:phosphocarrier protein HPr